MKVVGKQIAEDFVQAHADLRPQLDVWICEAEEASWQTPQDIKTRYVSASFLADNRVVFNLKGNNYRLVVKISYRAQIVIIEKIGTHADYSKWSL